MRERTVPDNGGVPLDDTTEKKRINERNERPLGNPEQNPSILSIGAEDDGITGINVCNPEPRSMVIGGGNDQRPRDKVLACTDCEVYYPDSGDGWEFCPQCASDLESFDVAGGRP